MSLEAIQFAVADAIQDKDGVITDPTRDRAIADAVLHYSIDCPSVRVVDLVAPGGTLVPVPTDWAQSFSRLQSIEFPVGAEPPQFLVGCVRYYSSPDGMSFRFDAPFATDDTLRVTYTTRHVVDATTDTVPPEHARGVVCLAAAMLCGILAAHYATEGAPTIDADITDHRGKTERFRAREKDLRAEYLRVVGVPDRATTLKPASATVALPSRDSFGDRRLFHPPTRRPSP